MALSVTRITLDPLQDVMGITVRCFFCQAVLAEERLASGGSVDKDGDNPSRPVHRRSGNSNCHDTAIIRRLNWCGSLQGSYCTLAEREEIRFKEIDVNHLKR